MTDDLVKRLRDKNCCDATKCNCDEAADRIERQDKLIASTGKINIQLMELFMEQKDRIEQLEATLRDVIGWRGPIEVVAPEFGGLLLALDRARAALGNKV